MNAIQARPVEAGRKPTDRSERRPVNLQGFLARSDGSAVEIMIVNMSYEGCRIEFSGELEPAERIKVAVLRRGAIDAQVRWVRGREAGLVFTTAEPQSKPRPHWPRRHDRIELEADVSMRRPGKHNYRVRMFDLSPNGCKAEFIERPEMDEQVMIKFDGLEALPAQVIWVEGAVGGFQFKRPIHPAVFDLLLARLG